MTALKPVSRVRCPGEQLILFPDLMDVRFSSPNHASPYIGDWAEEYASKILCGDRLITDATAICPDLCLAPGWYAEVKAVGPRNCFTLYRGRYQKYLKLVQAGHRLHFVFVHHDVSAAGVGCLSELRSRLASGVLHMTVVSSQTVFNEVRRLQQEWGGWRYVGGRAPGYREYHRLGGSWLDGFRHAKPHRVQRAFRTVVYGDEVWYTPLRVYKTSIPSANYGMHPVALQEAASRMLHDLSSSSHTVQLVPAPYGDKMVRRVVDRNPSWYEDLREEYRLPRRGESSVKRRSILRALERMADNKPVAPGVEAKLLPYVDRFCDEDDQHAEWEERELSFMRAAVGSTELPAPIWTDLDDPPF